VGVAMPHEQPLVMTDFLPAEDSAEGRAILTEVLTSRPPRSVIGLTSPLLPGWPVWPHPGDLTVEQGAAAAADTSRYAEWAEWALICRFCQLGLAPIRAAMKQATDESSANGGGGGGGSYLSACVALNSQITTHDYAWVSEDDVSGGKRNRKRKRKAPKGKGFFLQTPRAAGSTLSPHGTMSTAGMPEVLLKEIIWEVHGETVSHAM
jgi:hypothetical protein